VPAPKPSLKARALRYLAAREHSRLELGRKLERHASEDDDIHALLDWLEAQKFLSESRFAESLVHRRASRFGNSRILSELQSHGLDEATVSSMRASLRNDEEERAWQAWKKQIRHATGFSRNQSKANAFPATARFFYKRDTVHDETDWSR